MGDEFAHRPADIGAGSRVAGYRIDEEIGRGGMAIVYRAHDPRLDRRVALKILAPELAADEAFRRRFIRESRAAAAVDHPHIVPVFEAGEASGVLFIAMRLVQAGDVQKLIDEQGALPAGRACEIVTQVAGALDAAHAHGLVHRDVKPANMLLGAAAESDQPDHIYLSDFGLSKRALGSTQLTTTGQFLGTPNYISPEQVEGRPVDGRSDLYSLACCAYAMLAGAPPFRQPDSMAIMLAQLSAAPPSLTARRPELPAAVDKVLARALAKAPAQRYPACREFAAQLRQACRPAPDGAQQAPPARREATQAVRPAPQAVRPAPQAVRPADLAAAALAASASPAPATPAAPAAGGAPASPTAGWAAAAPAAPTAEPAPASWQEPGRQQPASPGVPTAPRAVTPGAPEAGPGPLTRGLRVPAVRPGRPAGPRPPAPGPGGAGRNGPGGTGPGEPARRRRGRRSAIAVAVAGVVVLALAGGYFLLGGKGRPARHAVRVLAPPGCTTAVAKAGRVARTPAQLTAIGGHPFDVATAPGGYAFVSLGNGVMVLSTRQPRPVILWTSAFRQARGEAMTADHRYLLVAGHSGVDVLRTQDLEQGPASPIGSLTSPGQRHAVEVALTPDDRYAFVTFQNTAHVGVFNLRRALTSGFGPADTVGLIPVGAQPIGVAISPSGRYAYVTSQVPGAPPAARGGVVNVISVPRAETRPARSVLTTAAAGCGPSRVIASPDGRDVWVSAIGANALLAFSAARLAADPRHALLARVAVGSQPLGLAFVNGGSRILVADSNRDKPSGRTSDLAVVNPASALAGRPALAGYLAAGVTPRQFAPALHGRELVTNTDSGQLETVRLAHLP